MNCVDASWPGSPGSEIPVVEMLNCGLFVQITLPLNNTIELVERHYESVTAYVCTFVIKDLSAN